MSTDTYYAVQVEQYGSPDVLVWGPIDLPPLAPGDIRIRTIAAAVNHTDLEIRAGNWPIRKDKPFPYVPGVEVVGVVEEIGDVVSDIKVGDRVITMMQGLGGVRAARAGGYATHVTVSAADAARLPIGVDSLAMAAIGLSGVTALEGLRRLGDIHGRTVLVSGAAGGVGSSAVSIARALGATVTAVVSRAEQVKFVRDLGAETVLIASSNGSAAIPVGRIDGVLDTVGAALFLSYVPALKPGGIVSVVGAVSGGDIGFDLWELIRPITLTGYSSENLTGDSLRQDVAELTTWLLEGSIATPSWTEFPLSEAAKAHALLEGKGVKGRVLLLP